eukprot:1678877-Rhodomonas_salina.1
MRLFMWASLLQFSEITTAAPRVIRCGHTSSYPCPRPRYAFHDHARASTAASAGTKAKYYAFC